MNLLIISSAKLPEGDAESVRLHTFGKLFREIGYNVAFIGMGYSEYLKEQTFDGFSYVSLRKKYRNKFDRIYFYFNYKNRLLKYLDTYMAVNKVDVILFADLSPGVISSISKFCRKRKIQIIADCVEWYSPSQFKLGIFSPAMILKNIENKFTINKDIKVIAISSYLYRHFKKKNCLVTRVPVILDVMNQENKKIVDFEKLTILYGGSPGKKDYLKEIIDGLALLTDFELGKIEFRVIGVTEEQLIKNCGVKLSSLNRVKKSISILGRVPRDQVLLNLYESDFSILLRSETMRYAQAGFPTKVVESLSTGTPVILNITSDLNQYIEHMKNGLIVSDCSDVSFYFAIKKALELTPMEKLSLQENARKSAEEFFDYRKYKKNIKKLLDNNIF